MLRLLASSLSRHAHTQHHLTAPLPALACSQPLQRVLQQGLHTSSSPSTGYSLFFKEEYPHQRATYTEFGDISRAISAKYKQLSPEQKQAYKERWQQVKDTTPPPPPKQPKEGKKGYSGWTLFTKERLSQSKAQLGQDEALDMPVLMKQLGEQWKALPQHEKDSYKAKAQAMPPKEQ